MRWVDNRPVHIISSFVGAFPEQQIRRYNRTAKAYEEIPCPNAIVFYNKFMGGIDSFDSYIALYRIKIKSLKKYYLRIFFHILDMMVINSWLLYRADATQNKIAKRSQLKLWDFKSQIAECLRKKNKLIKRSRSSDVQAGIAEKRRKGPVAILPPEDVRRDSADHLPLTTATKGRCKLPGCDSRPKTYCVKCNVHLCVAERPCFYNFHTQ